MKKSVFVVLWIAALCIGGFLYYQHYLRPEFVQSSRAADSSSPAETPVPVKLRQLDVDTMAARMKTGQDVYKRLRDDSLKAYAKMHPVAGPHDASAQTSIRLAAYLWVWDDYYGEGLWQTLRQSMPKNGAGDPLMGVLDEVEYWRNIVPAEERGVTEIIERAQALENTEYPAEFKYSGYAKAVSTLGELRTNHPEIKARTSAQVQSLTDKEAHWYEEMIKVKVPGELLYTKAEEVLFDTNQDEESINAAWKAFDQAFEKADPNHSARKLLEGDYYINYAWTARGNGYANTVSEDAWKLFRDRLTTASGILEKTYNTSTLKPHVAAEMITVTLGLELGKDQMETWFKGAIAEDPDAFYVYKKKMNFLLPRWYGSPEELFNFGVDCMHTGRWSANVPLIFANGMDDLAYGHPELFKIAEVWKPLEAVYREYLDHYPEARVIRTRFAKCAALGEHWSIAKEQFDLLGDGWNTDVLSKEEYAKLSAAVKQHAGDAAAKTPSH